VSTAKVRPAPERLVADLTVRGLEVLFDGAERQNPPQDQWSPEDGWSVTKAA
jgi:hypothetical protein